VERDSDALANPGWPRAHIAAPLRLLQTRVPEQWVDYNNHMSESCFLLAFGDSSDQLFRYVGIDDDYRAAGHSLYTVETHMHNYREAALGDQLDLELIVLGSDAKRIHIFHRMLREDQVLCTAEQMLVHVDMTAGRSAPMPGALADRVAQIAAAHSRLPRPAEVGHVMAIPTPTKEA
jgi:acyl-CoA thioester hydrolase